MRFHLALALLAIVTALLALVSMAEHQSQTAPLVQTASRIDAPRLFVPCPLGPQNVPLVRERKA